MEGRCASGGCEVKVLQKYSNGFDAFTVQYPDGWTYTVGFAPNVLEVTGTMESLAALRSRKSLVEQDIFEVAKEIGLTPAEQVGNGAISFDRQSTFGDDALLFRNFMVDQANHPELAQGVLGNKGTAPPMAALPAGNKKAFVKAIECFDRGLGHETFGIPPNNFKT